MAFKMVRVSLKTPVIETNNVKSIQKVAHKIEGYDISQSTSDKKPYMI